MNLADALERKHFSDGTCIIKQGDSADAFYIVEDGTVKITKDDPVRNSADSAFTLGTIGKCTYFSRAFLINYYEL